MDFRAWIDGFVVGKRFKLTRKTVVIYDHFLERLYIPGSFALQTKIDLKYLRNLKPNTMYAVHVTNLCYVCKVWS